MIVWTLCLVSHSLLRTDMKRVAITQCYKIKQHEHLIVLKTRWMLSLLYRQNAQSLSSYATRYWTTPSVEIDYITWMLSWSQKRPNMLTDDCQLDSFDAHGTRRFELHDEAYDCENSDPVRVRHRILNANHLYWCTTNKEASECWIRNENLNIRCNFKAHSSRQDLSWKEHDFWRPKNASQSIWVLRFTC